MKIFTITYNPLTSNLQPNRIKSIVANIHVIISATHPKGHIFLKTPLLQNIASKQRPK